MKLYTTITFDHFSLIQVHNEQCGFKMIQCVVQACSEKFQRRDEDEHYKGCDYRLTNCPFCTEEYIFAFEQVNFDAK